MLSLGPGHLPATMELRGFLLYFVLLATLLVTPSRAVLKSYFYRFGEDAGDTPLPDEDEISSPETSLRVPIVFFGQIYDSIFVSTISFGCEFICV